MAMVSYASNLEDVLLERVFADQPDGFFIDIGAGDPVAENVSWHFYQRGWRGIDVEPLSRFAAAYRERRPRDVVVEAGLGDSRGTLTLYENLDDWGITTLSESLASAYRHEGQRVVERHVEISTLADVCAAHDVGVVDFCKIDVEGNEAAVLRGADLSRWRPRVLVVEATVPMSTEPSHGEWEDGVLAAGYHWAYFDGVNRYYVADEAADLLPRLTVQPNWFDHYITYREQLQLDYIATLEREVAAVEADRKERLRLSALEVSKVEQQLAGLRRARLQVLTHRERR